MLSYESPQDPFDKIKGQIAEMLFGLAPNLANQIRCMNNREDNQKRLAAIYKMYLAKNALVSRELIIYTAKLDYLKTEGKENPDAMAEDDNTKLLFEQLNVNNFAETFPLINEKQTEIMTSLGCSLIDFEHFEVHDDGGALKKVESMGTRAQHISLLYKDDVEEEQEPEVVRKLEKQSGGRIAFDVNALENETAQDLKEESKFNFSAMTRFFSYPNQSARNSINDTTKETAKSQVK